MENNIKTYVLGGLLMICFITSCKRNNDGDLPDKLRAAILKINSKADIDNKNTIYLVIPTTGCEECISKAKKFFFKDIQHKASKTKFIFTQISSLKLFRAEMGFSKNIDTNKILLDTNNEIYRAGIRSIYPIIFIPSEDGVIVVNQNNYESLLKLSTLNK